LFDPHGIKRGVEEGSGRDAGGGWFICVRRVGKGAWIGSAGERIHRSSNGAGPIRREWSEILHWKCKLRLDHLHSRAQRRGAFRWQAQQAGTLCPVRAAAEAIEGIRQAAE